MNDQQKTEIRNTAFRIWLKLNHFLKLFTTLESSFILVILFAKYHFSGRVIAIEIAESLSKDNIREDEYFQVQFVFWKISVLRNNSLH